MIEATIIFNPVCLNFIAPAMETLRKYTDISNWKVIVVDQTKSGVTLPYSPHLYMKPHRNLGFAKSMNEGIIHGLRWKSKYIICANDDIEFINDKWWKGILDTFAMGDNVYAVNPESPRVPLWGYGREHGDYLDILPYKKDYSEDDYQYLLKGDFATIDQTGILHSKINEIPKTFPRQKSGVTDAVAMWCTVFKREAFQKFGLFDERFYPGGGEDYDMDARIYRENGRILGTTKSWVWHHWGQSKDNLKQIDADIDPARNWLNLGELWPAELNNGTGCDPWGHYTDENGERKPLNRTTEIAVIEI